MSHLLRDDRDLAHTNRPRPIKNAADELVRWLGVAGSLALALVGWGLLTAVQGDAVTGLLGVIPGAVNAITTLLTAFGILRRAEPLVTPLADPRDNRGHPMAAIISGSTLVTDTAERGSTSAGTPSRAPATTRPPDTPSARYRPSSGYRSQGVDVVPPGAPTYLATTSGASDARSEPCDTSGPTNSSSGGDAAGAGCGGTE